MAASTNDDNQNFQESIIVKSNIQCKSNISKININNPNENSG